jgi:hypothetical protein
LVANCVLEACFRAFVLATPAGFEPATLGLGNQCSIH